MQEDDDPGIDNRNLFLMSLAAIGGLLLLPLLINSGAMGPLAIMGVYWGIRCISNAKRRNYFDKPRWI